MAGQAQQEEDAITGINIIPLVDIVLVLLIIFMMTASFIVAPAVKIELPTVSKADEPPPRSLHFLVDTSGDALQLLDVTPRLPAGAWQAADACEDRRLSPVRASD